MRPQFDSLCNRYLTAHGKVMMNGSEKVQFSLIYGVWNGPGRFKKLAQVVNDSSSPAAAASALDNFRTGH